MINKNILKLTNISEKFCKYYILYNTRFLAYKYMCKLSMEAVKINKTFKQP